MVFVAAPEATAWVAFSKSGECFEHSSGGVGLEYDFSGLNRVPLWDVNEEVDVVEGEAEFAEFKPEAFQVVERPEEDVDVDLFSEAVVSVVGDEHHRHPVIAGVTRNLFRATAIYIFHTKFFSYRAIRRQANACRARQKIGMACWEKKRMRLFICGSYAVTSDHAVFPVATIKIFVINQLLKITLVR